MPEDLIDPPDDDLPWETDYKDDPIYVGDEVVQVESWLVRLEDATDFLVWYGQRVNTED
ncbi:hypothetical protein [Weissella cibaria]|uniref:hypothetical protein n=1 Tax=Weissella cibaria TaxID=137591 RepID=UPI001644AE36|nr:hypothetical protein [Weissella cibaria]MBU7560860.1 hypothetical protein [Weissella cibaria]